MAPVTGGRLGRRSLLPQNQLEVDAYGDEMEIELGGAAGCAAAMAAADAVAMAFIKPLLP
jgi:hypothetical protein